MNAWTSTNASLLLGLLASLCCLSGCAAPPIRKGDVFLRESNSYGTIFTGPQMPGRVLFGFPAVSLSSRGRVTTKVRDLPVPMFPGYANLPIPPAEDSRWISSQPWRAAKVRFTLRQVGGPGRLVSVYDFRRDWNGGSVPDGRNGRAAAVHFWKLPGRGLPDLPWRNYDFEVEVLEPSSRATDVLRIESAFAPFWRGPSPPLLPQAVFPRP